MASIDIASTARNDLNPKLKEWLIEWRSSPAFVAGANVFTVDFFQYGGVVEAVIALNDYKK